MTTNLAQELTTRITTDMRQALKDGRRLELDALRSVLARISNAEAIPQDQLAAVTQTELPRRVLSVEEIRALLLAEIEEMQDVLARIDSKNAYAADLRVKIAVVREYV